MMTQTPILVLVDIFMLLVLYMCTRPAFVGGSLPKSRRGFAIFLTVVFCLFSFWGKDWFGYYDYFKRIQSGYEVSSLENIYNWLGANLCPNYIVFRLFIWGSALYFFFQTVKKLKVNADLALFFFCSIYLIWFSYARASLAMAVMFFGYSLLIQSGNRRKLFGLLLIVASYFLHKSSTFGIVVILLSEVFKRFGKGAITIPLILFPFLVIFMSSHFGVYVNALLLDDSNFLNEYATAGNAYLTADASKSGPGVFLQRFLERAPYYLIAYISVRTYFNKTVIVAPDVKPIFLLLFYIVIFASVFAFNLDLNTETLYGRFLRFGQIPACIVLTYSYSNNIMPKFSKWTIRIALFSTAYSLLYVLYNSYVAQG